MIDTRENRIISLLNANLSPQILHVVNESFMHNVPESSETHFKVTVVSEKFETLSLIKRHRCINDLLKDEFSLGLHALSIHAYTPKRWEALNNETPTSPKCLDGFKHNTDPSNEH